MKRRYTTGILITVFATASLAHDGVMNPAVMARMEGMSTIAENMNILGDMVKGKSEFNADTAKTAIDVIAFQASSAPKLFEANEDDPKSEALPEIWSNFDDFEAKALELQTIANQIQPTIERVEDLNSALGLLGENCKSCHETYRK